MSRATRAWLGDRRMHLHHGPIDLIVDIDGPAADVAAAFAAVVTRFSTLLDELVPELDRLRQETTAMREFHSAVAQRMQVASESFLPSFTTPMIAVAGSVADEVCAAALADRPLQRVIVNNGGDIAFHLAAGAALRIGVVDGMDDATPTAALRLVGSGSARGVATSGWRGRSLSLGIADSVTTIATRSSLADVAATLIANDVDLPGHPAIRRRPAVDVDSNTDLGQRLVTVDVGRLTRSEAQKALAAGVRRAESIIESGLIEGAVLTLAGALTSVGVAALEPFRSADSGEQPKQRLPLP